MGSPVIKGALWHAIDRNPAQESQIFFVRGQRPPRRYLQANTRLPPRRYLQANTRLPSMRGNSQSRRMK